MNLLCVAYRLAPVDNDANVALLPEVRAAANLKDPDKITADVEKRKAAQLLGFQTGGPYVSRLEAASAATVVSATATMTLGTATNDDAKEYTPASWLRRLLLDVPPGDLRIFAFDVKKLLRVLAAECAVAGDPLPLAYWYGPNGPAIDATTVVLPSDYPWLTWPMAYRALGIDPKLPLPDQFASVPLERQVAVLCEFALRFGFHRP